MTKLSLATGRMYGRGRDDNMDMFPEEFIAGIAKDIFWAIRSTQLTNALGDPADGHAADRRSRDIDEEWGRLSVAEREPFLRAAGLIVELLSGHDDDAVLIPRARYEAVCDDLATIANALVALRSALAEPWQPVVAPPVQDGHE